MTVLRCPNCETDMTQDELLTVKTYKATVGQPSRTRQFRITATDEDYARSIVDDFMTHGLNEDDVEEITDLESVRAAEGYTLHSIEVIGEPQQDFIIALIEAVKSQMNNPSFNTVQAALHQTMAQRGMFFGILSSQAINGVAILTGDMKMLNGFLTDDKAGYFAYAIEHSVPSIGMKYLQDALVWTPEKENA